MYTIKIIKYGYNSPKSFQMVIGLSTLANLNIQIKVQVRASKVLQVLT